jgi:hypothetical protein
MSPEALRAAVLAIGAVLIGVAEFDDALVAAGIPALGILSAGVTKILFAVGTFAVGYAKSGRLFGDFSIKDVVGAQLKEAAAPKPEK